MDFPIIFNAIEKVIKETYIFNNVTLISYPYIIKAFPNQIWPLYKLIFESLKII